MLCDVYIKSVHSYLLFTMFNDTVSCFAAVLQGLLDLLVPLCRAQHVCPWTVNPDINSARHDRDKLYHQALISGDLML